LSERGSSSSKLEELRREREGKTPNNEKWGAKEGEIPRKIEALIGTLSYTHDEKRQHNRSRG